MLLCWCTDSWVANLIFHTSENAVRCFYGVCVSWLHASHICCRTNIDMAFISYSLISALFMCLMLFLQNLVQEWNNLWIVTFIVKLAVLTVMNTLLWIQTRASSFNFDLETRYKSALYAMCKEIVSTKAMLLWLQIATQWSTTVCFWEKFK